MKNKDKDKPAMLCIDSLQHKKLRVLAATNGETIKELTKRIFAKFFSEKGHE